VEGELLIRWSVRAALLCYVVVVAYLLLRKQPSRVVDAIWTAGCVLFCGHVIAALHYYHHWSHAHAFKDTAVQTEALLGLRFGYGIYFSYLFTLLWVVDVYSIWTSKAWRASRRWLLMTHGYLFFIAVNGAIIFHTGVTRWFGITACVLLAGCAWYGWKQGDQSSS